MRQVFPPARVAELTRLGDAAVGALRNTVGALRLYLPEIAESALHPLVMQTTGRPTVETAAAAVAAFLDFGFELAEEARLLLRQVT